ncbi:hypothetical protein [Pantoea sp. At-9b]|uniref:hypothetical protein n=1 Tax=Pantoea sp. (strain At-9b) TaxID=592316 RepID=UPI00032214EA|nr:hypothetical protein [Pantoea sp. At-9b]
MTAEIKAALVVLLLIILLSLVGGGAYLGYQYKSNSARADAAEKTANQSSMVTANVLKTVSIINSIVQANADAKQKTDQQSAERIVVIQKAVAADECAKRPVPAAAVEQLRNHANRIHAGATRTNTGKPAD